MSAPKKGRVTRASCGPIVWRLAIVAGYVVVLAVGLGSRSQRIEGHWVGVMLRLLGEQRVSSQASVLLVHPVHGLNVLLLITWSCSSAPVLATVGAAGLMITRAAWWRRLAGLAVASSLVIAVNLVRLATSTEAAVRWGSGAMLVWHDWVGTGMTLGIGAAAIWVFIRIAGWSRPAASVVG